MIESLLKEILAALNPRARDVVIRRAGLKNNRTETLESIGGAYGITRERIRQIEVSAFRTIASRGLPERFSEFESIAANHLANVGGCRKEEQFFDEIKFLTHDNHPASASRLRFLLGLSKRFVSHEETDRRTAFWATGKEAAERVMRFLDAVVSELKRRKEPVHIAEVNDFLVKTAAKAGMPKDLGDGALIGFMAISKEVSVNPFGEYGLREWSRIVPRGARDRAYHLVRYKKTPMHFKEISSLLNAHAHMAGDFHPAWQKPIEAQTVHNELIKDPRFVLIGRGTYALREWGYQPGTVKDVLVDVLRVAKQPLSREDVVRLVKEKRLVRDNTVLINLQNKRLFKRLADGRYQLKSRSLGRRINIREA